MTLNMVAEQLTTTSDAAGDDPRTDQESPRLLPSTPRHQVPLAAEEDAATVEDTDGTEEDKIVDTATAATASSAHQLTTSSEVRQRRQRWRRPSAVHSS